MELEAFNPATVLGRRDVLRALAACLADWWLPRRVFAQSSPKFKKPDRRVCATMAHWLGVRPPDGSGRAIPSLIG